MNNFDQQADSDEVESSQHEKAGRNSIAESRIKRRSYLKLLGISTLPLATGRVEAAETGYGHGGYGEGGYGGADSTGAEVGDEISEPVIETLEVSNTSPPNPHVDLEVSWSVLHEDDALEEVRIIIRNDNDRLVDGATISVGGGSASGLETFRITHGSGESYVVTLSVSDQVGNVTREDTTIST